MAFATPKPKGRPAKDKHGTRNTRQENVAGQSPHTPAYCLL